MGDFKDKHGKSRLGKFIQKAGNIFPDILEAGVMLSTGNVLGAVEMVTGKLEANKTHSDPQARLEAQRLSNELEMNKNEFLLEAFMLEVEDRKDARALYSKDSAIQKAFSVIFLIGYGVLSWYLLLILTSTVEMPDLAETMITMIWTGTSTKLNTIVDFLFGGSM